MHTYTWLGETRPGLTQFAYGIFGVHTSVLCGVNGPHHPKYKIKMFKEPRSRALIKLTYAKMYPLVHMPLAGPVISGQQLKSCPGFPAGFFHWGFI